MRASAREEEGKAAWTDERWGLRQKCTRRSARTDKGALNEAGATH